MSASSADRGAVVITGTSSGIGEACVKHLQDLGFTVFAGVRKPEDGERLRAATSGRVVPVLMDVTDDESIRRARDEVDEVLDHRGLAGVVNNAGATVSGPLEFVSSEDLRWQFEVNTIGPVAVTREFMPAIRRGPPGRIVNVGSIGGRLAAPFNGPYSASKFAMEAISDSLRREVSEWGIEVSLIEPGSIATEIWRKGLDTYEDDVAKLPEEGKRLYGQRLRDFAAVVRATAAAAIPPEEVAKVIEHALTAKRPRTRYVVGRDAKGMAVAARLLPDRLLDRIVARRFKSEAAGSR